MKILHISDLQIPRTDKDIMTGLFKFANSSLSDLVLISGDLTQRAGVSAFKKAANFISELPAPAISVPGNHDIPLYDAWNRFWRPLRRYKKFISGDPDPRYSLGGLGVAGINTARSFTLKEGAINFYQSASACYFLKDHRYKIVMTHHPLGVSAESRQNRKDAGSRLAKKIFYKCRVGLFLSGHHHINSIARTNIGSEASPYYAVFLQAGTISRRLRGEPVSFNLIEIENDEMSISRYHLFGSEVHLHEKHVFFLSPFGWQK
jgi:3',5'-cyclic AMP phosphodiesterase CpdA